MARQRDKNGRFVAGHKPYRNGGRKPRSQEEEITAALSKAMPLPDVLQKLREAIARRESWAVSLYLNYVWGKPKERKEHDILANILVGWDDGDNGEADDPLQSAPEAEEVS